MSLHVTSADANHLTTYSVAVATPFFTAPLSIGMWLRPTSLVNATQRVFIEHSVGGGWSSRGIQFDSSGNVIFNHDGAAGFTVSALAVDKWYYILARAAGANARLSVLKPDGSIVSGSAGSAWTNLAGTTYLSIGSAQLMGGTMDAAVAELWYANSDVQPDGLTAQESLVRQLAYGGPFSVPNLAPTIREYRSFRVGGISSKDRFEEVYFRDKRNEYTCSATEKITDHPPLPYWYAKPGQRKTTLTI
jgi:hypothetical protein